MSKPSDDRSCLRPSPTFRSRATPEQLLGRNVAPVRLYIIDSPFWERLCVQCPVARGTWQIRALESARVCVEPELQAERVLLQNHRGSLTMRTCWIKLGTVSSRAYIICELSNAIWEAMWIGNQCPGSRKGVIQISSMTTMT